jgi:hypothetical protein
MEFNDTCIGSDGQIHRFVRVSADDTTPTVSYLDYRSACGLCWLNQSHTVAAHNQRLEVA